MKKTKIDKLAKKWAKEDGDGKYFVLSSTPPPDIKELKKFSREDLIDELKSRFECSIFYAVNTRKKDDKTIYDWFSSYGGNNIAILLGLCEMAKYYVFTNASSKDE